MTETSEDEDALAWLDFIVPDEPRVPRASRALHHPPPSPVFSPHPLLAALDSLWSPVTSSPRSPPFFRFLAFSA